MLQSMVSAIFFAVDLWFLSVPTKTAERRKFGDTGDYIIKKKSRYRTVTTLLYRANKYEAIMQYINIIVQIVPFWCERQDLGWYVLSSRVLKFFII